MIELEQSTNPTTRLPDYSITKSSTLSAFRDDPDLDGRSESRCRHDKKYDEHENEATGHESSFREGFGMEGDRQVF